MALVKADVVEDDQETRLSELRALKWDKKALISENHFLKGRINSCFLLIAKCFVNLSLKFTFLI